MKQSDQEIVNAILRKLSVVGDLMPSAISTGTIEASDKNGQNAGLIWACSDQWAWLDFEKNRGGSGVSMTEAWKSLNDSMTLE